MIYIVQQKHTKTVSQKCYVQTENVLHCKASIVNIDRDMCVEWGGGGGGGQTNVCSLCVADGGGGGCLRVLWVSVWVVGVGWY